MSHLRSGRGLATIAATAAVYFVAGRLGLRLAFANASASPVWPPTGIALAAILLFGYRVWPGIWIGAFLVNLATAGTVATSIGVATGNTLEGVLGAWLARRFASGPRLFDQPSDVFTFAALTALLATTVSATIGNISLALGGFVPWSDYGTTWLTWWLGDAAGALVVAPFLVLWGQSPRPSLSRPRMLEAGMLLGSLILVGQFVFGPANPHQIPGSPLKFLCFPVLIWAALRFSQLAASTAVIVLSGIAIAGALRHMGSLSGRGLNEDLLVLQAFMAVASVSSLTLSASVAQRRRIAASLRQTTEALEQMVIERTGRLWAANQELRKQAPERERAVEQLQQSDARLREAQEVARIGSWEWDIRRDALWWSEALFSIYGLDRETFRASYEGFLERVHPDDRERVVRIVAAALEDQRPFSFDHRIVRPDGQILTVHGRGRVLADANGKPVRMIGTGQDVTEGKRAEEERDRLIREQAARHEAEEASRLKDEFLATLSHELRNPLSAISLWAHLLQGGRLDRARRSQAIEAIQRSAALQNQLIRDLLDLSRVASGRLELSRQPVDLAAVIGAALDSVRPVARARRIRLLARLDGSGEQAMGDAARVQQVVWNLLSNALRFAPEGGRVGVSLTTRGAEAQIRVEDDGPGIDPELLPHIFDRFRQGGGRPADRDDGLGIGLAIVKHLVELHGGSVCAANLEGSGGAVFTVTLPLVDPAIARAPAEEAMPATPVHELEGADGPGAQPLRNLRILVVEDDRESRDALTLLLAGHGAEVETAESCAGAMAFFEARPPDVLISDIEMAGEDGYALLARVRSRPSEQGGAVPAIAVTAYAGAEDARKAIRCGYQAHLAKPFDYRDLLRIIEGLAHRVSV